MEMDGWVSNMKYMFVHPAVIAFNQCGAKTENMRRLGVSGGVGVSSIAAFAVLIKVC